MIKSDLINSLREQSDKGPSKEETNFITRSGVANALGYKDPHNIDRYLVNLQRIGGKKYYIPDVAAAIMQEVTTR